MEELLSTAEFLSGDPDPAVSHIVGRTVFAGKRWDAAGLKGYISRKVHQERLHISEAEQPIKGESQVLMDPTWTPVPIQAECSTATVLRLTGGICSLWLRTGGQNCDQAFWT